MAIKNILITGAPGTGKTTLIKKLIEELNLDAGGFYTQEVRQGGQRIGFDIVTVDGREGVLSRVGLQGNQRVGKYGVTLKDLEEMGVASIRGAVAEGKVVVIDEIGKMELFSQAFKDAVIEALGSKSRLLGTIKLLSDPFTDRVKKRNDTTIIELTRDNRDEVKREIKDILSGRQ